MFNKMLCLVRNVMIRIKEDIRKNIGEIGSDNRGVGIIEVILILVILIAVVLLFKDQIMDIIDRAFSSITNDSNRIIK